MKKILILSLTIFLASCATSYHRKSFTGGYSELQIEKNIFQVSFKGNSRTSVERSVDFTLLRSAELTLQNGYDYFVIIKGNKFLKENQFWGRDHYGPYIKHTFKPRVFFKIKCFKTKPEKHSYNALLLAQSIRNKYKI